ncbi:MAG: hypothetical protein ABI867_39400 [Kofleriaceae bacterium]
MTTWWWVIAIAACGAPAPSDEACTRAARRLAPLLAPEPQARLDRSERDRLANEIEQASAGVAASCRTSRWSREVIDCLASSEDADTCLKLLDADQRRAAERSLQRGLANQAHPACKPSERTTCSGDRVMECAADASLGRTLRTCPGGCRHGACIDTCAVAGVELIYLADADSNLLRFDPAKLPGDPFQRVGKMECDPTSAPWSMAVDRGGVAWVLYKTGKLYQVSILDAHCVPATGAWLTGGAPTEFGMGFVTDAADAKTEQLFGAADSDDRTLARVDLTAQLPAWRPIGVIEANQNRNPELTGTGEGKLFAYYPQEDTSFVQELDRTTAKGIGRRWEMTREPGSVQAYAFAHWGGVFYVFTTVNDNSAVRAIHRKTGKVEIVREHLPTRIVGAGVSTCAPQLERG